MLLIAGVDVRGPLDYVNVTNIRTPHHDYVLRCLMLGPLPANADRLAATSRRERELLLEPNLDYARLGSDNTVVERYQHWWLDRDPTAAETFGVQRGSDSKQSP